MAKVVTHVAYLPDGNWLVSVGDQFGKYWYQVNPPNNLDVNSAIAGYGVTGGMSGVTGWIKGEYANKLIYITMRNGDVLEYHPGDYSFSIISRGGTKDNPTTPIDTSSYIYTLEDFLSVVNFGSNDTKIRSFFTNSDNDEFVEMAKTKLNYQLPPNNNKPTEALNQLRQLYWGAYFCSKYPITDSNIVSGDCDTILQTIQSLKDDYATVQQQISTTTANQFYGVDTAIDYNMELQAITDLSIVYNGLASKSACTKAAAGGGSKLITYAIIGFVIIVIVVVVKKSKNKSN